MGQKQLWGATDCLCCNGGQALGTVKRDTNQHLVLQSQASLLLPGKGLLSLGLFGGHKRKGGQETRTIYFIPGLLVIV